MGFKRLSDNDIIMSADSITAPLWSSNEPNLTSFFTSSLQVNSNVGKFYTSIYNRNPVSANSEVQFHLAYCNSNGSGSEFYNNLVTGSSPSKTNYYQYKNLILGDENTDFVFGNFTSDDFIAINIERSRYKEKLLPGTMTLNLMNGPNKISLTDDSSAASVINFKSGGRVFNLVSGSSGNIYKGVNPYGWAGGSNSASGSYGWFLPDIGVILINNKALEGPPQAGGINLPISRSFNSSSPNTIALYNAFVSSSKEGDGFTLNSEETITSNYLFIKASNHEFNYSENPSFVSGSTGTIAFDSFITSPKTYITTIGLYNDNNELLAVGKLSRPLQKDFIKELNLRMKLDF